MKRDWAGRGENHTCQRKGSNRDYRNVDFNKIKKLNFFRFYGKGRCKGGIRDPPVGMMLRGENVYPEKGFYSTIFFVKKIVG
jgi:hypothetical protein